MKYLSLLLLLLVSIGAYAQDSEFTRFADEVKFYNLFIRGKIDSLKVDEANQNKFRPRLDEVFRKFVLYPGSEQYSRFVRSRSDQALKFINGNNMFEVEVDSINDGDKIWLVYGYTFSEKKNYMVKDFSSNKIVWEGNSNTNTVQLIGKLDSVHYVVVEENGDVNAAREAFVVKFLNDKWTRIKGFEGKQLGTYPADLSEMKYVKRRERLQLEYRFDMLMTYSLDVNDMLYNPSTKTLSYRILLENRNTKTVSAQWKNGVFLMDDYFPEVSGDNVVAPER